MENQPRLFTSRAELYLTIIRHRTERPSLPFISFQFGLEVHPEYDAHTHTPASLQPSIDTTHNKQAFYFNSFFHRDTKHTHLAVVLFMGLVCMR